MKTAPAALLALALGATEAAMADLKNSADALKEARKAYDAARESCKTKSYTPQDMQAADAKLEKAINAVVAGANKKM